MFRGVAPMVLVLAAAGCGANAPATEDFWSTAPQSDEQRWAVLERARAIDPCALIPLTELARHGTVAVSGPAAPESCETRLNSAEPDVGIKVFTKITSKATVESDPFTREIQELPVEGSAARVAVDADSRDAEWSGQGRRFCDAQAVFDAGMAVSLQVTAPEGTDACAIAEPLIRTAARTWGSEPARGGPEGSPRTALSEADPCAVAPRLGANPDSRYQLTTLCAFEYDGGRIVVNHVYASRNAEPVESVTRSTVTVAGREVTRSEWSGQINYGVRVGPAVDSELFAGDPRFPTVTVLGEDDAALTEVVAELVGLHP